MATEADELAALRNEYTWMVQRDVPSALAHLGTALTKCLQAFPLRRAQEGAKRSPSMKRMDRTVDAVRMIRRAHSIDVPKPTDSSASPLFDEGHTFDTMLQSADGMSLQATMQISGLKIVRTSIQLKSMSRGTRARTPALAPPPLVSTKATPLAQLQAVVNYVDLCLLTIAEWSSLQAATSAVPCHQHLSRMVERVCSLLAAARATLSPPVAPLPEENLLDTSTFLPTPASDMLFGVHVDGAYLTLRLVFVNPLPNGPPAQYKNSNDAIRPRGGSGHVFNLNRDRWFEVVSRVEAVAELPFLKDAVVALSTALLLAQRLQEKVAAFATLA